VGQRTESLIFTKREFQSNVEIVGKTLHVAIKDNFLTTTYIEGSAPLPFRMFFTHFGNGHGFDPHPFPQCVKNIQNGRGGLPLNSSLGCSVGENCV